jgi:hypothetical protein
MRKLGLVVLSALTCALLGGCAEKEFVERVTITNESAFPARVELRDASDGARVTLATIGAGDERAVEQVIDRDVWIFVFSYARTEAVEVRMDRSDLEGRGWAVEVPPEFETELREVGLEPPGGEP